MMALFGAPIAHEDHAQRACLAALYIRDAVVPLPQSVRARHGVRFDIRIGLNSGEVMVGRISDDLSLEYTALGHDVGLAQRMESLAEPGHICLSEQTGRLVEGYFQLRGRAASPSRAWSSRWPCSTWKGPERSAPASTARAPAACPPLSDATATWRCWSRRWTGRGTAARSWGSWRKPGTGKSRLCAEFLEHCRVRAFRCWKATASRMAKPSRCCRSRNCGGLITASSRPTPGDTRAKISGRLLAMDQSYGEDLPIIFDLFGVPDPANPAPAIDPEQRQKRLHNVVKRVLHDPRTAPPEPALWCSKTCTGSTVPAMRSLKLPSKAFRPAAICCW